MQITSFNRGIHTKLDPSLIPLESAQKFENVDINTGILQSAKDNLILEDEVNPNFVRFKDEWISSNQARDYVEYRDKLYYTEPNDYPKVYSDSIAHRLGIERPESLDLVVGPGATTTTPTASQSQEVPTIPTILTEAVDYRLAVQYSGYTDTRWIIIDKTINIKYNQTSADQVANPSRVVLNFVATSLLYTEADEFGVNRVYGLELEKMVIFRKQNGVFYELYSQEISNISNTSLSGTVLEVDKNYGEAAGDISGNSIYSLTNDDILVEDANHIIAYNEGGASTLTSQTQDLPLDLVDTTAEYKFSFLLNGIEVGTSDESYTFKVHRKNNSVAATSGLGNSQLHISSISAITVKVYRKVSTVFYLLNSVTLQEQSDGSYSGYVEESVYYGNSLQQIISNDIYTAPTQTTVDVEAQYAITFYDEATGVESAPTDTTQIYKLSLGFQGIRIENIPISSDPQVSHKRIYKLRINTSVLSLIGEIPNEQIIFDDFTSSEDLLDIDTILDTYDYFVPSSEMHSMIEAYSIFFGIVNDEVVYSKIDQPYAWPPENAIPLDSAGVGLLQIPQGILLFTKTKTFLLTGTTKATFSKVLLSDKYGSVSHKSGQNYKHTPLWVSYEGICTLQNGTVKVISRDLLGLMNFDVVQSTIYDSQYLLLTADSTIWVLDFKSNLKFYVLKYSADIKGLFTYKNELYYVAIVDNTGVPKLCKAFEADDLNLSYTSPVFTEGNYSMIKLYSKIYCRANGEFNIKMYIDDKITLNTDISGNETFKLLTNINNQKGYGCNFEINGKGKIYSIASKPKFLSNG